MNHNLTIAALLAALCALPAVAADDAGPDVTVNVDSGIGCETTRLDVEDILGPAFLTRTDIWTEDCDASAGYHGIAFRARCTEFSTKDIPAYSGPDVTLDRYCGVTVDL